jgi:rod shape-determining protein MreC
MRKFFALKLFIVFLLVLGVFVAVNLTGFSGKIKNAFYSFSSSLQGNVWEAGNNFSNFFEGLFNAGNLKKEMNILLAENQELLGRLAQEELLKEENEFLREALGLKGEEEFSLMPVKVIGKDISGELILVNKGKKDGVSEDMPVITVEKVVVGKISSVYDNFSEVMLLSNADFSFDVRIIGKDAYGVSKGKGGLDSQVDLIPKEKDIAAGDIVLTAVLGGIFPEGLLVGEVREVNSSDVESFQKADLDLFLSLEGLDDLLIIKDF